MALYYTISILIFIVCILLILIVLIQNSKGGGLTSTFSGSNQVMGVKKTTDFLEKSTWTLSIVLLLLTLSTIFVIPSGQTYSEKETSDIDYIRDNENPEALDYKPVQENQALPSAKEDEATEQAPVE
ncbi:MAG: preprotein translocase subunit SecG [Bacteroidales bacterium]|nr:preprotein translocase subunit SecG [Bacteroidales bacterium]